MAAGASGILEEHGHVVGRQALGRIAQSQGEGGDALFDRGIPVAAGMQHQEFGAQCVGALQFAAEGGDRAGADHRVERRQIDKIVYMYNKWTSSRGAPAPPAAGAI